MAEWTDAKKRDQYTKVCEVLGLIDYPDGRAPYLAYPSEVIAAIYRLVDESPWIELAEGCRMPELGQVVLLTLVTKGNEDHAIIARGLWRDGYFDSNELVSHHALVGCFYDGTYRFVRPWGSKADAIYTVTAWMPAPEPFRRQA